MVSIGSSSLPGYVVMGALLAIKAEDVHALTSHQQQSPILLVDHPTAEASRTPRRQEGTNPLT